MRVIGKVGSQSIHILIDSDSIHNFLDSSTAKKLRYELQKIPPLVVAVANGAQLKCIGMCRNFAWSLGDLECVSEVYLVPLGSCDMVLGVQWLSTLGPILWNFENPTMEFYLEGKKHLMQEIKGTEVSWPQGER